VGLSTQPDAASRWPEHLPVGAVRVGRTSTHYDQANGGVTYRDSDGRQVVFVSWVYGVDRT